MRNCVRVGIGGWTYAPWRGSFYPHGVTHKGELHYASRQFSTIEVNGTYYRTPKPDTFVKWHDETPEDFVFALKAPRFATNRKVLAEAGPAIERFVTSGITALKSKLGPINWQFMATHRFDPQDFEAFLQLLPAARDGCPLRHVVDVRHDSFATAAFTDLLHRYGVAAVMSADSEFPTIADSKAPFFYVRLMGTVEDEALGYPQRVLDQWARRVAGWAPRDVYLYVIGGHKPRNPLAAMALRDRLA